MVPCAFIILSYQGIISIDLFLAELAFILILPLFTYLKSIKDLLKENSKCMMKGEK